MPSMTEETQRLAFYGVFNAFAWKAFLSDRLPPENLADLERDVRDRLYTLWLGAREGLHCGAAMAVQRKWDAPALDAGLIGELPNPNARPRKGADPERLAENALRLALHGVRNSDLEDHHAAGVLGQADMRALMREVVNRIYTLLVLSERDIRGLKPEGMEPPRRHAGLMRYFSLVAPGCVDRLREEG